MSHRETLIDRLVGILTVKVAFVQHAISAILIVSLAVPVTLLISFLFFLFHLSVVMAW